MNESLSSEEQYIFDIEEGFIREVLRGYNFGSSERRDMEYLARRAFSAFRQPERFLSVRMFKTRDELNRERLVVFMEETEVAESAYGAKSIGEETAPLAIALRPEKSLDLFVCKELGEDADRLLTGEIRRYYGQGAPAEKIWQVSPVI